MALNPRQKSSFIFNIQVFVLNVMFMIEIWYFRNKTLSLHSKPYPFVINLSSKLPQKIHDWSILCLQSTITSTTKSLLRQSSHSVSFQQAAFLSTLNSVLQRLVPRKFFPFSHRLLSREIKVWGRIKRDVFVFNVVDPWWTSGSLPRISYGQTWSAWAFVINKSSSTYALCFISVYGLYYTHFEITGDAWNLIDSTVLFVYRIALFLLVCFSLNCFI